MEFSLKPTQIKSNKTGKTYDCYKLKLGDFERLVFPQGNMERNYLKQYCGSGLSTEVKL